MTARTLTHRPWPSLGEVLSRWLNDAATASPPPAPRGAPLLIGDILTTRSGEPELLIRWRAAAEG